MLLTSTNKKHCYKAKCLEKKRHTCTPLPYTYSNTNKKHIYIYINIQTYTQIDRDKEKAIRTRNTYRDIYQQAHTQILLIAYKD